MAQIIRTDGTVTNIEPKNGTDFSSEEIHQVINGYIELYYLSDGKRMIILDEEGKLKDLPYNEKATEIADIIRYGDVIVGDVILCDVNQLK